MAKKIPIIDLGIKPNELQTESNPVITLQCTDLEGYEIETYTKVERTAARGGDYLHVTFKNPNTGATFTLPALLTCGLGVWDTCSSITIQLRGFKRQSDRLNWTPWITKINPE